jgi:four helix bundle protein
MYRATRTFPKDEWYGSRAQIRRASSSISANIAEGCGRRGQAELAQFLNIAMGSASELEYHPLLARDLELLKGMLVSFAQKPKPVERGSLIANS